MATHGIETRIRELREQNDWLLAENANLKDALTQTVELPPELGLTKSQRLLLGKLMTRQVATRESLMDTLYFDKSDTMPSEKTLDALICYLRKKLKPHGITVRTQWGTGFYLNSEDKSKLRAMCAMPADRIAA